MREIKSLGSGNYDFRPSFQKKKMKSNERKNLPFFKEVLCLGETPSKATKIKKEEN